jgi:hypothetical protein
MKNTNVHKSLHETLSITPYWKLYSNLIGSVLGCIDSYDGVQRYIFKRLLQCTRKSPRERADLSKSAIFAHREKFRRAATFAYI